tara:strand:+ start:231 stop:557 length:327 start_codon:yes stop_codon:yes gene_type:complete
MKECDFSRELSRCSLYSYNQLIKLKNRFNLNDKDLESIVSVACHLGFDFNELFEALEKIGSFDLQFDVQPFRKTRLTPEESERFIEVMRKPEPRKKTESSHPFKKYMK